MRVLHAACQAYCLGNSQINFYREVAPQAVDSSGSLSTHRLQLRRHCARRDIMAWGAPRGVDDLIAKLKDNKTANTMCILSTRKFGATEAAALSAALASNTSLQELLASGHPLGAAEAAAFGEALSRNTTLRSLCLGDNSFGDEGVLALVAGLRSNRGLLVLDLEYKSVSSGEGLAALLETHPTLTDLRLGRNQLGEPGIKALSAGLSRNSTLLRLDLSGNKLDAAAADSLGRALCPSPSSSGGGVGVGGGGGPPPLEFLDVSKNPLGDEGGAALFRALAAAAAAAAAAGGCGGGAASTLRVLRLAEADLGVGAAAALAAALSPAATGTGAGTGTGGGDAEAVSNAGGIWPLLETLDISKNELGTAGAAAIAGALARGGAPRLESLSVGYNGVGDEGAAAIGRAAGPALSVLDLSGSALSGAGIGAVMSASGLREAKLFHNECGDEGVPLVLEALLSGGKLKTLDLGANGLTGAGVEALLAGLGACPSLQTLEIGANSCDEIAEAAVRLSQSSNPSLDIAFRRGGEAMEGSGAPPGIDAAELQGGGGGLT